jgi:hypothetical protein
VPTNDQKFNETLAYTNGELQVLLGQLFNIDPADICRWGIVMTAHVPNQPSGTHDIRVASNCLDPDIPVLLMMGIDSL